MLVRHELNKLPQNQRKRSMNEFKRYEKQVPGHRIQIDVKFLDFKHNGSTRRRIEEYLGERKFSEKW